MAQPNLTDALIEYTFTAQEFIIARQLTPLQIFHIQTRYARLFKLRGSLAVPPKEEQDGYFRELAEIDGRLAALQELLDDHKAANAELMAVNEEIAEQAKQNQSQANTAERAASLVHKQS